MIYLGTQPGLQSSWIYLYDIETKNYYMVYLSLKNGTKKHFIYHENSLPKNISGFEYEQFIPIEETNVFCRGYNDLVNMYEKILFDTI